MTKVEEYNELKEQREQVEANLLTLQEQRKNVQGQLAYYRSQHATAIGIIENCRGTSIQVEYGKILCSLIDGKLQFILPYCMTLQEFKKHNPSYYLTDFNNTSIEFNEMLSILKELDQQEQQEQRKLETIKTKYEGLQQYFDKLQADKDKAEAQQRELEEFNNMIK